MLENYYLEEGKRIVHDKYVMHTHTIHLTWELVGKHMNTTAVKVYTVYVEWENEVSSR